MMVSYVDVMFTRIHVGYVSTVSVHSDTVKLSKNHLTLQTEGEYGFHPDNSHAVNAHPSALYTMYVTVVSVHPT